jgi:hypothetical protein
VSALMDLSYNTHEQNTIFALKFDAFWIIHDAKGPIISNRLTNKIWKA